MRQTTSDIKIGTQIVKYPNRLAKTNKGNLIDFHHGSDTLLGAFPGCSWSLFYDDLLPLLSNADAQTIAKRKFFPIIVILLKDLNECQSDDCHNNTNYWFCSLECWIDNATKVAIKSIKHSNDPQKILYLNTFIENAKSFKLLYNTSE